LTVRQQIIGARSFNLTDGDAMPTDGCRIVKKIASSAARQRKMAEVFSAALLVLFLLLTLDTQYDIFCPSDKHYHL